MYLTNDLFNFNDLFNVVFKSFDRPLKEVNGYKVIQKDYGYCLIINALGVDKNDLKIEVNRDTLRVSGKTEIKEIEFTNSINLVLDISQIKDKIEKVKYTMKDGLVYISLHLKQEKEKKIDIEYEE